MTCPRSHSLLSVERLGFDLSTACPTAPVPLQGTPPPLPLRRSGKVWEATGGAEQGNDSSGWEETSLNHMIKNLHMMCYQRGGLGIDASAQVCVSVCVSASVCLGVYVCGCVCV